MKQSILSISALVKNIKRHRKQRKKIVFTNGCFDLIHAGHIRLLNQAKRLGDILIVAINSDPSVRWLKGEGRPILPLKDRLEIIGNLKCVDYVIPLFEKTPYQLIQKIQPDVLIKGGDWKDRAIGSDIVQSRKGKIVSGLYVKGKSTSQIIEKIKRS